MSWSCHGNCNDSMVTALRTNGILKTRKLEDAMRAVDRRLFVLDQESSYLDSPQPIGYQATISAPDLHSHPIRLEVGIKLCHFVYSCKQHMHAHCLELLREHLVPGASVLDVGSGSGYLTAVFAHLVGSADVGGKVIGVEHIPQLVKRSQEVVQQIPFAAAALESGQLKLLEGDGKLGHVHDAPYDVIHVGAAAETIPHALLEQLSPGGRLLIPVGPQGRLQVLVVVDKQLDGSLKQQSVMRVMYVPLTGRPRDAKLDRTN